ncbi:MAG: hypothetical protein ACXWDF_11380 [Aeromicrobium sp.]
MHQARSSSLKLPFAHRRLVAFVLGATVVMAMALPVGARAAVSHSYAINGIEVWATVTVGTFVGTATGSRGDKATWQAAIEHTPETIPSGRITGGYARLLTSELTFINGRFTGGRLRLLDDGEGACGDLTHKVRGKLGGVTRSDSSVVGTGLFVGRLVHYRVSVFGNCIPYAATASGTISLTF